MLNNIETWRMDGLFTPSPFNSIVDSIDPLPGRVMWLVGAPVSIRKKRTRNNIIDEKLFHRVLQNGFSLIIILNCVFHLHELKLLIFMYIICCALPISSWPLSRPSASHASRILSYWVKFYTHTLVLVIILFFSWYLLRLYVYLIIVFIIYFLYYYDFRNSFQYFHSRFRY